MKATKNEIKSSEWEHYGTVIDSKDTDKNEKCALCGKQGLRFQFEIINKKNESIMVVGSECIKKFDVPIIDDEGNVVEKSDVDAHLDLNIMKVKKYASIKSLRKLYKSCPKKTDKEFIHEIVKKNTDKNKIMLSPRQAKWMISLFEKYQVRCHFDGFGLNSYSRMYKDHLMEMTDGVKNKIMNIMTKNQIGKFINQDKNNI